MVSELVPYKRVDTAVRAFSKSGRRLQIAGDGPEFAGCKKSPRRTSNSAGGCLMKSCVGYTRARGRS